MLFSHVKISSFRAKAHLVFHWCLYNKNFFSLLLKQGEWYTALSVIACFVVKIGCLYIVTNIKISQLYAAPQHRRHTAQAQEVSYVKFSFDNKSYVL